MTSLDSTQLSIAMATCNGEHYIRQQLESIRLQTRTPDQLVISDDASTDKTIEIVNEFKSKCPFPIIFIQNKENLGLNGNFENAIHHCTGDFIAICDQDDYWKPKKLEIQLKNLNNNPEFDAVFSDADLVDKELHSMGQTLFQAIAINDQDRELLVSGKAFRRILTENSVAGMTLLFKSRLRILLFPIPEYWPYNYDWWIAILLSSVGKIMLINKQLVYYRQHGFNHTGVFRNQHSEESKEQKWVRKLQCDKALLKQLKFVRRYFTDSKLLERRLNEVNMVDRYLYHLSRRIYIRELNSHFRRVPISFVELISGRYLIFSNSTGINRFIKDTFGP